MEKNDFPDQAAFPLAFWPVTGYNKRERKCLLMSEDFGANFVSLTDEDGNEFELEHLDTLEYNGQVYMAFFPVVEGDEDEEVADVDLDDEEYGLIILKVVQEDGEEQLVTLDDEDELETVYNQFMEVLFEEEEEE